MSDEEKKVIEKFKNFIYTYQDVIEDEYSDYEEKESAKEYQEVSEKILNIIEKQSKEIEESKLKNEKLYEDNLTLAQEIKELKMQLEVEKIDNKYNQEEASEEMIPRYKIKAKIEYYEKIDNPVGKRVLQSLLEKE